MPVIEKSPLILVVDDDSDILEATCRLLQNEGYQTLKASNGKDALIFARANRPDLILLDVILPDIDGFEVCRTLRNDPVTAEILIMIVSARKILSEDQSEGLEIGADDYIVRPIENREFIARVRAMLRLHKIINHRNVKLHQKQSELLKAYKDWQNTFDAMSDVVWIIDDQYRILRTNKKGREIFQCAQENLIGRHCWEVVHGTQEPIPECPILRMQTTLQRESAEIKIEDQWFRVSVDPVLDENGKFKCAVHLITDITHYRRAEDEKRKSEESFRALFKASGDGILIAEIDTLKFVEANPAICEMFGYEREELLAKTVNDIHPSDSLEFVLGEFKAQALGERLIAQHIPCLTKHGTLFHADISTTSSTISGKECNIGFFRDVTEKMLLEKQLQNAQKLEAIGTFAGGIAHDFNNMLGVITGNVSFALSQMDQTDSLYEVLNDVQEGAKQAKNLTHQLITFAKGGSPIKKEVKIAEVLQDALNLSIRGTAIQSDFDFQDDLWSVAVDPEQMKQVFFNLFLNAMHAMPEGGTIKAQVKNIVIESKGNMLLKPGPYLEILIIDQGVGISERHLTKIFDPYFSTKQKGKGFGLAITHSIIKKHDGHIFAESQLDRGSTFYIYLPALSESIGQAQEQVELKRAPYQGRGRVLLMDDQPPILKMSARILKQMGYESACAIDGQQAIEMYRQAHQSETPFDLVILDLTVPGGMGGAKAIPELLRIDPRVKAIVSSGYSNDPVMANFEAHGFCGVIPKPYTKEQLEKVLKDIFAKKE